MESMGEETIEVRPSKKVRKRLHRNFNNYHDRLNGDDVIASPWYKRMLKFRIFNNQTVYFTQLNILLSLKLETLSLANITKLASRSREKGETALANISKDYIIKN
jgi:hypothetical protein